MIIKQLNAITLDRVIPHDKLMQIANIEQYLQEQKAVADAIVTNAQQQIAQEVTVAKSATITELQEHNQQLLATSEEKLTQVLDTLHSNIYAIIAQILTKCGVMEINSNAIKELLTTELARFSGLDELRIKAHPDTLKGLSQGLNISKDKIIFEADPNLDQEVCICETELWIMNLAVSEVRHKILEFLQQSTKEL